MQLEFEKIAKARLGMAKGETDKAEKSHSREYQGLVEERKKLQREKLAMQKEKIMLEEARAKNFERKIKEEKEQQLKLENDHLRKLIDGQGDAHPRRYADDRRDPHHGYPDVYIEEDSSTWTKPNRKMPELPLLKSGNKAVPNFVDKI